MRKRLLHIILLLGGLLFSTFSFSQSGDAFSYVEKYNQQLDSIRNYQAVFTVKASIPLLKIPVTRGKVFFKWPTHYSLSTYQFTVLPKQKLTPVTRFLRRANFKITDRGTEPVNNHPCRVVELHPYDTLTTIAQYTIWVDKATFLIRRVYVSEKDGSEYVYHYSYNNKNDLLPSKLLYTFNYTLPHEQNVMLNPVALKNDVESSRVYEGKIAIDFKYSNVRRQGDHN